MPNRILVVDDDRELLKMVKIILTKSGYEVQDRPNGDKLLSHIKEFNPSLIILDLMLPDVDGLELCKQIKADKDAGKVPVIMLTAKGTEMDKVLGLEVGAEDYITKPFSVNELVARVRTVIRRGKDSNNPPVSLNAGAIRMDDERHEARVAGEELKLTPIEYQLLKALLEGIGRALSRDDLLERVWGYDQMANTRTVDVHVRRLRQKLGPEAKRLQTVSGVGYKLVEE